MLELKQGVDILSAIGGVKTLDQAQAVFEKKCDQENLAKLQKITNEEARLNIANAIAMMDPDTVFVNTGSAEDVQKVRELSLEKGEERPLAMKDHTIHFDLPQEQARIVDRTFYIVNEDEDVSVLAKKILRADAFEYVNTHMPGIAKGKRLFVGFFSRGPVGAEAALPALEITTSTYVMHSGNILYRNVYDRFDEEVARVGHVITNVHSEGPNRPEDLPNARVFMDRSWLTTFSMFCTYAGNTLLLKKGNHRFAVDLATYYKKERELSEHMFVTGLKGPDGTTYFAGAAPSGCGKTTTAMVGTDFIGDDLAQLWIAEDGTLRAINPEKGIFGIVQDVNREGDPHLMKALREEGAEVIWSNVLIDENGVPHWVGHGEEMPKKGTNFQGEWWEGKTDANGKPIPPSHPNSRCTLANRDIANYNEQDAENPAGVHVKVITYSGRDSDTMPPVVVAKSPDHGVVIGASVLSAATATEVGVSGVRRQPWANEPFIPGPLADYMDAQFAFFNSDTLTQKPIMASLNYFLTEGARGGEGTKLLGEKRDVKAWLGWLERCANGRVEAIETPIGFIPKYDDLQALFTAIDKEYPKALYDKQFALYIDNIIARIDLQEAAYKKEPNIPATLFDVYEEQRKGLEALKAKYGAVVTVEQLIEAAGK
ncbi:phosphoenolpyruvate carboxykinase (GTP) [candidate division KSB3 bacterium]|uniref:Phosphoenolpyruvate carboxykinase [GTP] n=1 Tax=candidate division KSB3 bacterium TaxID=2044937 RepID=A0A9D5JZD1_9BACT|nr:phosphoenolpyruvate carboxykinase (GTP) [candidate division KSB3 bacterium]MBD3326825.1 phosphoenolpyruvate carboxykinase (GTP) [candidate division KSB3 bacterium]